MNACPFCGFDEGWVRESPWNIIEKRNPNDTKFVIQCHVCSAIGPESVTEEGAEKKWNGYLRDEIDSTDKGAMQMALDESMRDLMGGTYKSDEGLGISFSDDGYIEFFDPQSNIVIYQFGIPLPGEMINLQGAVVEEDDLKPDEPYLYLSDDGSYLEIFINNTVEYTIYLDELQEINEDVGAPMSTLTNTPGMGNAVPPSKTSNGSGDKWGNEIKKKKKTEEETNEDFYPSIKEENINPYDKIGTAMAKKMKVPMTFKNGKNKTVKQKKIK